MSNFHNRFIDCYNSLEKFFCYFLFVYPSIISCSSSISHSRSCLLRNCDNQSVFVLACCELATANPVLVFACRKIATTNPFLFLPVVNLRQPIPFLFLPVAKLRQPIRIHSCLPQNCDNQSVFVLTCRELVTANPFLFLPVAKLR